MTNFELAQLNIARMVAPLESPEMSEFVDNLGPINALAEQSPGYVSRLQTEEGDATALQPFGDDWLVNMSVWADVKSLKNFVYRSAHIEIMRRRREWFVKIAEAYTVLWWVPKGHIPTIEEAKQWLDQLRVAGPGPEAFSFRNVYPVPESHQVIAEADC